MSGFASEDTMGEKAASWAIEVERVGKHPPEYFAVEALTFDDKGIHITVAGGSTIEFKRTGVKRVLIMKTVKSNKKTEPQITT